MHCYFSSVQLRVKMAKRRLTVGEQNRLLSDFCNDSQFQDEEDNFDQSDAEVNDDVDDIIEHPIDPNLGVHIPEDDDEDNILPRNRNCVSDVCDKNNFGRFQIKNLKHLYGQTRITVKLFGPQTDQQRIRIQDVQKDVLPETYLD